MAESETSSSISIVWLPREHYFGKVVLWRQQNARSGASGPCYRPAAGAMLQWLCCKGYAARAMLQGQGLCRRGHAAGAMLQGLCCRAMLQELGCNGYAAVAMMHALSCRNYAAGAIRHMCQGPCCIGYAAG